MAGKEIDLGPTGKQVKANVARVRRARGLSFAELSRRLGEVGRPIPPLGLRRIEEGLRRVDVDDIFALATVLWVTPSILMLPATRGDDDMVEATGVGEVASRWLWAWSTWSGTGGAAPTVWKIPDEVAHLLGYDSREGLEFVKSQAPREVHTRLADLELRATVGAHRLHEAQRRLHDAQSGGAAEGAIAELQEAVEAAHIELAATHLLLSQERGWVAKQYPEPSANFSPYLTPDDAP